MNSDPRKIKAVSFAFWTMGAICLWNLNGMTALAFGQTRILSIAILGLGFYIISAVRGQFFAAMGAPGSWFVVSIAVYLGIGASSKLDLALVISHVNSVFLVFAGAVGTRYLAVRQGMPKFLTFAAVFASVGAMTVYLSPFLGSLYRKLETTQLVMAAGRWLGFFANPNETGMAGVYALCATLANSSVSGSDSRFRRYTPVIVCILGLGVLLTFSRGAMVAFAAVAILYMLTSVGLSMRSIKVFIGGTVLFSASFIFFTQGYKLFEWTPEQRKRIRSVERLLTGQKATSFDTGNRMTGAKAGLMYWQRKPVFGHGLGALHKMPYVYTRGLGCHNTHVMVLGESGVFGAFPYTIFWFVMAISAYRIPNREVRSLCLMLGLTLFLNGMVGHTMLDNRNANLMLGIGIGMLSLSGSRFPESTARDEDLLSD